MTFSEAAAELIAERDQLRSKLSMSESKLLMSELVGSLLFERLKIIADALDDVGLTQTAASARKAIADVTESIEVQDIKLLFG